MQVPDFVYWLVIALVALAGFAFVVAGLALFLALDVDLIARAVADGTIQSDVLSGHALVDVTYAVGYWGSVGLIATGVVALAIGVVVFLQTRRANATDADSPTIANATVGAVVSVVLGFVPLSTILGGAVAGYFEHGGAAKGARAGALSGLVFSLVPIVLSTFVLVGGMLGAANAGESAVSGLFAAVIVLVAAFTLAVSVATGALGGYVGWRLDEYERARRADRNRGENDDRDATATAE